MVENRMRLEFYSKPENEAFARTAVAAFVAGLDPTMEELTEIKTAISEAVSNSIIHAYKENEKGVIIIDCYTDEERKVTMIVSDFGVGITDIAQAREPMFTTGKPEERSGMGFTIIESFMDRLEIESSREEGTKITMLKNLDSGHGF